MIEQGFTEDLANRILLKPKRKNQSRVGFRESLLLAFQDKGVISLEEMQGLNDYPEQRMTRKRAIDWCAKEIGVKIVKTDRSTWQVSRDDDPHYDSIANQIRSADPNQGFNITNAVKKHGLSFDETKKALEARGCKEFQRNVWSVV